MIAHPFSDGERAHFAREDELAAGLRHGYLELPLWDDEGILLRVIRYQAESDTYLWYESPMGWSPRATKRRTYATLAELLGEVDVHVYVWHPLYPKRHQAYQYGGQSQFTPFRYPTGAFETVKRYIQEYPTWDPGTGEQGKSA